MGNVWEELGEGKYGPNELYEIFFNKTNKNSVDYWQWTFSQYFVPTGPW